MGLPPPGDGDAGLQRLEPKLEIAPVAEMKDMHEPMDMSESDSFEDADVNDNAVVLLVRKIIEDANYQMASDIHIEPTEKFLLIRIRKD